MTTELFELARVLSVEIEYTDLTHLDRDGDYDHATRVIRLQSGMAHRLLRSVLAHEVAHAVFEDIPSRNVPANAKQERRADEWAALQLVDLIEYRDAELLHDGNVALMAQALDVIEDIVYAYQRVLLRIGDVVYEKPRHGVGQWQSRMGVS